MLRTFWSNLTAYLNGSGSNTPVGALNINTQAAETGILLQQIDLSRVQNLGDYAQLELEILALGAAPQANQTVTVWYAFCSSGSKQVSELKTAASSFVCNLGQALGRQIFMPPLVYQSARYLYVWFDHTAQPAGGTMTLTLNCNAKTS